LLVDENGRRAHVRLSDDGSFRVWGTEGKLSAGSVKWSDETWVRLDRYIATAGKGQGAGKTTPSNSETPKAMIVYESPRNSQFGNEVYLQNRTYRAIVVTVQRTQLETAQTSESVQEYNLKPAQKTRIGITGSTGTRYQFQIMATRFQ
ncbi:MAG TPA: hypothetical protein DDW52_15700, partial [Planctomycetaceae bacterium]|nr:hypothetical protein [Planctomycetaceae bacterium]